MLTLCTLSGCGTLGNKYFCPPDVAYDEHGTMDTSSYRVKVDCYKSMTKKQAACYKDAQ